jgi:hypothetical protein
MQNGPLKRKKNNFHVSIIGCSLWRAGASHGVLPGGLRRILYMAIWINELYLLQIFSIFYFYHKNQTIALVLVRQINRYSEHH